MQLNQEENLWGATAHMKTVLGVDSERREELMELPVVGITLADATAFCRWAGERDQRTYRLPNQYEWEKAGRGVDGRVFPWGDHFDATFCKMRYSSTHQRRRLEVVGKFVDDSSPYGVRDLSGGVQEWCERDKAREFYPIRGGAWDRGERLCRLASTRKMPADHRALNLGMRLVYDLGGQ